MSNYTGGSDDPYSTDYPSYRIDTVSVYVYNASGSEEFAMSFEFRNSTYQSVWDTAQHYEKLTNLDVPTYSNLYAQSTDNLTWYNIGTRYLNVYQRLQMGVLKLQVPEAYYTNASGLKKYLYNPSGQGWIDVIETPTSCKLLGTLSTTQRSKLTAKNINADNITTATSGYMYVGTP